MASWSDIKGKGCDGHTTVSDTLIEMAFSSLL
jgi:hypothetical protein